MTINALSNYLDGPFGPDTLQGLFNWKTYDEFSSIVTKLGGSCYISGEDLSDIIFTSTSCTYVRQYLIVGIKKDIFFNFLSHKEIKDKEKGIVMDRFKREVTLIFLNDIGELSFYVNMNLFTVDNILFEKCNKALSISYETKQDIENARVKLNNMAALVLDPYVIFDIALKYSKLKWYDHSTKSNTQHEAKVDQEILDYITSLDFKFDLKKVKDILNKHLPFPYYDFEKFQYKDFLNNTGLSVKLFGSNLEPIYSTDMTNLSQHFYNTWKTDPDIAVRMGFTDGEIRELKLFQEVNEFKTTKSFPENLKTKNEARSFRYKFKQSGDRKKDNSIWWHLNTIALVPEEIKVRVKDFVDAGIPKEDVPQVKKALCKMMFDGKLTNNGYSILEAAKKMKIEKAGVVPNNDEDALITYRLIRSNKKKIIMPDGEIYYG